MKHLWCGRTFFISSSNGHDSTAESRMCLLSLASLSLTSLTHTERQTNRQTHTHLLLTACFKFFEGNIIYYNLQLLCNALAAIQSFNSELQSMQDVCTPANMSKHTPEADKKMQKDDVIGKGTHNALQLWY